MDLWTALLSSRSGLGGGSATCAETRSIRRCGALRAQGQERHAEHAPDPGRRAPGPEPAPARESDSPFVVFVSERGSPFTTAGFARMIERAAAGAGMEIKAPRLRLRPRQQGHDTRAIQGWLGHRSITSTAVYTALAPNQFKDFWRQTDSSDSTSSWIGS
jgi:integrase